MLGRYLDNVDRTPKILDKVDDTPKSFSSDSKGKVGSPKSKGSSSSSTLSPVMSLSSDELSSKGIPESSDDDTPYEGEDEEEEEDEGEAQSPKRKLRPRLPKSVANSVVPVARHVRKKQKKTNLTKAIRNDLNLPQRFCDLVEKFTGGVDLDPCSNAASKITAKVKYGYDADGSFTDALEKEDWDKSDFVYLNPLGADEKLHGPLWTKCFEEIRKGNVKRVLAIVPQQSFGKWNMEVISRSMVCFMSQKVLFEQPDGTPCKGEWFTKNIIYLDTDKTYPLAERFVDVFGQHGYIPGYSMRSFKIPRSLDWKLRFFSFCSGIGVADKAVMNIFPSAECVGFCENDPEPLKVYQKHFRGHRNFGDAMTMDLENLPDFDLLVGGPPCQAFSQQRSAHPAEEVGWDDPRSKLVKRFIELRKVKAPLHFLMENVASMKVDVQDYVSDELNTRPIRINSKEFTAQCRDRIYWCSWHVPPLLPKPSPSLSDIIELSPASVDTPKWKDLPKDPPTNLIAAISRNTATT
ncbi:hypothetical protein HKX48_000965, partial [Thoreauomyces humboldtii]